MKGNLPRLPPVLHPLAEERAGERRLPILSSGPSFHSFETVREK
jgi:hypothetical protein